jgi:hypothetical protein
MIYRPSLLVGSVLGLFLISGCGDDGLGTRYRVSGTVTYAGKPVERGMISFVPAAADGRGASGEIKDGAYTLTTNTPEDGAFPGKYKVTVSAMDTDAAKVKAEADIRKLAAKAKVDVDTSHGIPDPAMMSKALRTAKNKVPTKYASPATTDLKVEVKAETNSIPIELKD